MQLITLVKMMEKEEYQALTCKEFAQIVRRSEVLDEEEKEEDEPFPLFAEESMMLQRQKEEKEHYGDYSDQGDNERRTL